AVGQDDSRRGGGRRSEDDGQHRGGLAETDIHTTSCVILPEFHAATHTGRPAAQSSLGCKAATVPRWISSGTVIVNPFRGRRMRIQEVCLATTPRGPPGCQEPRRAPAPVPRPLPGSRLCASDLRL